MALIRLALICKKLNLAVNYMMNIFKMKRKCNHPNSCKQRLAALENLKSIGIRLNYFAKALNRKVLNQKSIN